MKSGKKIATFSALAFACAPVVARATTLFSDDFDAGTSATRYDSYSLDTAAGTHPPYDTRAVFNFDYGAQKYWHIAADQSTQNVGEFIPQAPRSTGAAKVGLLLDANNDATGSTGKLIHTLDPTVNVGFISPGYSADIIILAADPLTDIRNTRKIAAIYHHGKLIPNPAPQD